MKLMHKVCAVFLVLLLSFSLKLMAQSNFTIHAIAKGETLSALAKKYHTTVGDIMRLNDMGTKSLLKIGQKIKIPSGKTNKPTATAKKTVEPATDHQESAAVEETAPTDTERPTTITPKYHVVGKKETLYGIGKKYQITVAQIKGWNNLTKDNIHQGQKLIIGITATAATPVSKSKPVNAVIPPVQAKVVQQEVPTQQLAESKPVVAPVVKPVLPVAKNEASNLPYMNTGNIAGGSFFADQYQKGNQELSGDAATFKTASGWLDKKYYVLINNIDAGTIIRVVVNNKAVFAKVLGPLPDIKEDTGLLLRLSNAAASALGITDAKFSVTVNY
jgi:LysM repeat protein